jgi:hypothetical protein
VLAQLDPEANRPESGVIERDDTLQCAEAAMAHEVGVTENCDRILEGNRRREPGQWVGYDQAVLKGFADRPKEWMDIEGGNCSTCWSRRARCG